MMTERLSLLGVFQRQFVGTRRYSQRLRSNANPSAVEGSHRKGEPKSFLPDPVFLGNPDIGEHQGMGVRSANTHLVLFLSDDESLHATFYNQGIDSFVFFFRMRLRDNQIHTRAVAVGNPVLGS